MIGREFIEVLIVSMFAGGVLYVPKLHFTQKLFIQNIAPSLSNSSFLLSIPTTPSNIPEAHIPNSHFSCLVLFGGFPDYP